jgi:hypothetical protein
MPTLPINGRNTKPPAVRPVTGAFAHSRCCASYAIASRSIHHFAGTESGAPLSFTKNTMNLAAFVLLALRETVCTSSGDS